MKHLSNWKDSAICANDKFPNKWLSYDFSDVEYAKKGCAKCTVRKQCLANALQNDSFVGVIAGMSEYDYLNSIWKRASEEDESNWRTDDTTFSRLLQKV